MAGSSRSDCIMSFIINTIKQTTGEKLFHKCPYQGRVEIVNLRIRNENLFSIYPRGKYLLKIGIFDEKNLDMMTVAVEIELLTS